MTTFSKWPLSLRLWVVASGTFDCSSQVVSREKPVSMSLNDQNNLYHGVVIHLQCIYYDTHKTVKTRNINYVMLLCWKEKGNEACPEFYCDWSPHNQHSWKFSAAHGFLSFTVTVSFLYVAGMLQRIIQIEQGIVHWYHKPRSIIPACSKSAVWYPGASPHANIC